MTVTNCTGYVYSYQRASLCRDPQHKHRSTLRIACARCGSRDQYQGACLVCGLAHPRRV